MKRQVIALMLLLTAGCQAVDSSTAATAGWRVTESLLAKVESCPLSVALNDQNHSASPSAITLASVRLLPPSEMEMQPALPGPEEQLEIDLREALERAGVDNPTIALALEAVRASEAQQLQARALLVPTLIAGGDFNWHDGKLQNGQGEIIEVQRQSAYVGAGAEAVGAGTLGFPGVSITANLGDALFEPQAASYHVASRQFDAQAIRNTVLLDVASAYFGLVGAMGRLQAMRQSEEDFAALARITKDMANAGQGREADANRAKTQLLLHHAAAQAIEEEVAVAAAELARLLNLDPNVRLVPPAGSLPQVQLVNPKDDLERLIQIAMLNRPEIAARSADVSTVQARLTKENWRPFMPTVALGFSAGGFGGGGSLADTGFGHWNNRTDIDAVAYWTLYNLGLGNLAMQRHLRAEVAQAVAERSRVIDVVRREVAEAFALVATRRRDMELSLHRLQTSENAFRQDLIRARNALGHPIEVLDSANLLSTARQAYVSALTGFNQAEVQLFVSMGQPPQ